MHKKDRHAESKAQQPLVPLITEAVKRKSFQYFEDPIKPQKRRIVYYAKTTILILFTIFTQHVNLFGFQFEDYNVRLLKYIALLFCFRMLKTLKQTLQVIFPLRIRFLSVSFRVLSTLLILSIVVLFFCVYDFLTPTRILFLAY